MDLVPGMVTYFWMIPTRTGTFEILCAELCGVGHHAMRGYVVVEEESDFEAWLEEQVTFEEALARSSDDHEDAVDPVLLEAKMEFADRGTAK